MEENHFEIPRRLDNYLASLAIYYQKEGHELLESIIVNSTYRVVEEYEYDGIDGGQHGHAIYFEIPEEIFHKILDDTYRLSTTMTSDLNKIINIGHEHIANIFFELQETPQSKNWRQKSGVLLDRKIEVLTVHNEKTHLWTPNFFRLFLSHKSTYKDESVELKDFLDYYGITAFVAHNDIKPTRKWQDEIERALLTMDGLLALMTDDYHQSDWTDQEVGAAVGRLIPIISVNLGMNPYGFIGKFQALPGQGKETSLLGKEIFELLFSTENELAKREINEAVVARFERAGSFSQAKELIEYVEKIDRLSAEGIERLRGAEKNNSQVRSAWGVPERVAGAISKIKII